MSDYSAAGFYIKQIHDRLEKQANNALRANNMTLMQVSVLMTLQEAEGKKLSMKELEHSFGIAQSTAAGIVSRLEQKGFVEAIGAAADKRIKLVHITPSGEECCAAAAVQKDIADKKLLKGFSEEEKIIFRVLLAKAAKNME